MNLTLRALLGLTLTLGVFGCDDGSDDGDDADAGGSAPAISDLTFDPATIPPGQASIVTGRLRFTDPDGDVDHLMAHISVGALEQDIPPVDIQNVDGIEAGEVAFALQLQPPGTDPFTIEVWLVDLAGNSSPRLTGQVTVE